MKIIPPFLPSLFLGAGAIIILVICLMMFRSFLANRISRAQQEEREKWEKIVQDKDKDLQEAQLEAETANSAKSRFLASISHEIRTPMNSIMGTTELLMNTELDSLQAQYLSKIRHSSKSLLRIINNLLDFSRIESGMLDIEKVPFSLDSLFERIYDHCANSARQKGLEFTFYTDPDSPRYLKGDPTRLAQIMINLVNNAVKFTEQGYIRVEVIPVSVKPDKVQLQFRVRDSGTGIHPDQLHKIFESFLQEETSLTRRHGGLGLGLSISKHLVQMMGGEIRVESEVRQGSCFYFLLWFESVEEESEKAHALEAIPETERDDREAKPSYVQKGIKNLRILLVEDNDTNRELVREMLEEAGATVTESTNGIEALQTLQTQDCDFVFMDLEMPEMNGLDAVKRIRKAQGPDSEYPGSSENIDPAIPVIAMTGHASTQDREKCLQAGMDDYISKPFNLEKILEVVRHWERTTSKGDMVTEKSYSNASTNPALDTTTTDLRTSTLGQEQLQKIRRRFLQKYSQQENTLADYLEAGEWEKGFRFVHDSKTMAAYMGDQHLYNSAVNLEQELNSRSELPSNALIQNFQNSLQATCQNLKQEVENAKEEADPLPGAEDLNNLASILEKIYPEVEQNKPRSCKPLLDELQQYSWPHPYNDQISRLGQLIQKYRFKEALDIIHQMLETLSGDENKR